jgi:hypothetical protein
MRRERRVERRGDRRPHAGDVDPVDAAGNLAGAGQAGDLVVTGRAGTGSQTAWSCGTRGAITRGSVGPKAITAGVAVVAATCMSPESFPT